MKSIIFASVFLLASGWVGGWFSHALMGTQSVRTTSPIITQITNNQSTLTTRSPQVTLRQVNSDHLNVDQVTPTPLKRPQSKQLQTASSQDNPLQIFRTLLTQGAFSSAFSVWPQQHEQARSQVFDLVSTFDNHNRQDKAISLINKYRDRFPSDIEAGLLHAKILHQQTQFDAEAFLLIALRNQTADMDAIYRINHQLQQAVHAHKAYLMQSEGFNQVLSFYRHLSNLDGANTDYQLMQAIALIDMGHIQQASTILQPLVFDPEAGHKATSLLRQIKNIHTADYQASIPLQRSGEHFLVPLSINGKTPILLLLDTGASITLVQSDDISASQALPTITLHTANGSIDAPLMASNRINLGTFQLDNIKIALISKPLSAQAKGLLGMNILKHFDFFIDQHSATLKLSRRSPSTPNGIP